MGPQHGALTTEPKTNDEEVSHFMVTTTKFTMHLVWADLTGPEIYLLYVYLFAADPKNTKYPRMGLTIGLRGCFWM